MTLEEYLKAPPMTPEENAYASNVKFAKFNQENKTKLTWFEEIFEEY